MKNTSQVETFLNPAGFIEQHYVGRQTASSVEAAIKSINKYVTKLKADKQPVLILMDISQLKIVFDRSADATAARGLRHVKYDRGAIYGPVKAQVFFNTIAMVAGVSHKVRAFSDRLEAIEWLRGSGDGV